MSEEKKQLKNKKVKAITIKLSEPIEWGDEVITELVLKRPKAAHLEHLSSEPNMKQLLQVAQKCANVPSRIIRDLDGADAMAVVEAISDFLDSGLQIGKVHSY
jgi:hypothetical protein